MAWTLQCRFGDIDTQADGQAADGLMASAVINAGWKVGLLLFLVIEIVLQSGVSGSLSNL